MGVLEESNPKSVENLVIVGSGPAGYTAAIYAARANLQPLLLTGFSSGGLPGGQLMTTTFVENFPGFPNGIMGPELMDLIKAQAVRWGTELLEEDLNSVDLSVHPFLLNVGKLKIKANSLIIATGASANRLNLPSESKFWSKGISACAICDGATPQFRNEELAVVGGGDSACEEAIYLTKYGSVVHLLVRSQKLRASASMAERVLLNKNINVHFNSEVIDVDGDEEWIRSVRVRNTNLSQDFIIQLKGLFYAIGHTPNTKIFSGQLEIDANRYILTEPGRTETSKEGVFAAGDVADSEWRQGVTAAGSGCKAALSAERWLSVKNLSKTIQRNSLEPPENIKEDPIEISNKDNYDPKALWQIGGYALRKLYHESDKFLLVIYTSPQCGPCHILKPQIKRLINELGEKVQGIEIDIEKEQDIAIKAGVKGTPTTQLFKSKDLKKEWIGVKQRSEIKKIIQDLL